MAINQIAIRNSEGNFENLFPLTIDKGGTSATTLPGAISNLFPTNYGSAGFPSKVYVTCFSDGFNQSGHCTVGQLFDYASKELYPVGAVYISYNSTSPATLFGGSWVAITGRFPYFNAGTVTGGSNTHTLSVNEMPSHTHQPHVTNTADLGQGAYGLSPAVGYQGSVVVVSYPKNSTILDKTGGNAAHNNMPAYQTLYAWRRTA